MIPISAKWILIMLAALFMPPALLAVSAWRKGLSIPSQVVRLVLPLLFPDREFDEERARGKLELDRAAGPAFPSVRFRAAFDVHEGTVNGFPVVTAAPRSDSRKNLRILYIHGGAYVFDAMTIHWGIAEELIRRTGATLVMPIYPLAPEHNWRPAHQMVTAVYMQLVQEVGADNVVVAGDSAGGGFSLALAMQLRDAGRPMPAALLLFSPWLDVTISDPAQVELDAIDPVLTADALRAYGRWWAANLSPTDPRISPLFGTLAGLPPIAVFTGTEDLLYPDALRLSAAAAETATSVTLVEYPHQFHVWMGVFPKLIPEAAGALDQAARFVMAHAGVSPAR